QLHFAHTAEAPAPQPAATSVASTPEVPTARDDRAAMREVLKERRENAEPPAEVRPVVTAAPAPAPAAVPANPPAPAMAQLPAATDSIAPNASVERAAVPSRPNVAAAPLALPRA